MEPLESNFNDLCYYFNVLFSFLPFSGLQGELTGFLQNDGNFHIQCYRHERGE